jgi:hypothetical protein
MKTAGKGLICGLLWTFMPASAQSFPDVSPNPRSDSVVLRDHVVRPGHHKSQKHQRQGGGPKKSGCTYSAMYISCPTPRAAAPTGAVFTPGMARSAVQNLPMPALTLHVQPDGPTLVNADTIFYTEPRPFETSVELLGHTIEVRAEAVGFTWVHGDGTSQSTSTAGAPYPNRDVTHRYMSPSGGMSARVDTAYEVEFSIDGGGWDELGAPLVAAGPPTSVEVQEAAPVLVQ